MQKKVLFGFDYTDNEFVKIILYLFVGGSAIILYLFVGGSAALIEWAFFYAFSEAAGINYLASTALAYFLSTLYHYFMCNILVFTSGVRYGRAKELSLVFLVSGMGLLFNLLLMYLFVGMFGMPGLVSKIVFKVRIKWKPTALKLKILKKLLSFIILIPASRFSSACFRACLI